MKDLLTDNFLGYVVDNEDPQKAGRCRIRVYNLFDNIPDDMLAWATPAATSVFGGRAQGALSVPKKGTIVRVKFNGGNIYNPEYSSANNIDTSMIEEHKGDYIDTQVLVHDIDHQFFVIFQPNRGFQIFYKDSYIQIHPDNMISLVHANEQSIIQLQNDVINIVSNKDVNVGGNSNSSINITANTVNIEGKTVTNIRGNIPDELAVNGKALMRTLSLLADIIDTKSPQSPGVAKQIVNGAKGAVLNTRVRYN